MTDQAIINLKKKLDNLSSKGYSKEKVVAPKVEEPKQFPLPTSSDKKDVLKNLTPEDIRDLKIRLGLSEPKVPQEIEELDDVEEEIEEPTTTEPIEPTEEDLEQFKKIQAEIDRLHNTGAFRVEILYQLLGINAYLNKIAIALERRVDNGKK